MREQIQRALDSLIGMPLRSSGRAADLEWFHFGQRRTVTRGAKKAKEKRTVVQSPQKMEGGARVLRAPFPLCKWFNRLPDKAG